MELKPMRITQLKGEKTLREKENRIKESIEGGNKKVELRTSRDGIKANDNHTAERHGDKKKRTK